MTKAPGIRISKNFILISFIHTSYQNKRISCAQREMFFATNKTNLLMKIIYINTKNYEPEIT